MKGLKQAEKHKKYYLALQSTEQFVRQKRERRLVALRQFVSESMAKKVVYVIFYLTTAYLAVAVIFNLPPANWLTDIQILVLNGNTYYPILNIVILAIPLVLIFRRLGFKI